ncbi:MAG TPA: HAD-IA family hydrolase [Candidatus Paceibacterota bacterium]|nr:HAD-IA family hydrolase [Candidatus Paceibacterota bacterium]HPT18205.1 HAD-IA family hydrolase [Candidatus Paceibacterota bacterium]
MKTILVDAAYTFTIEKEGKFVIFQDLYKLLETYPSRKILLTGANEERMKKYALDNAPYPIFTQKHNPEKSDPKYYETLLKTFNLNKEEVVYFEHAPEAVKSAESIGIKSYFYDNEKKDLTALKKFLDENL